LQPKANTDSTYGRNPAWNDGEHKANLVAVAENVNQVAAPPSSLRPAARRIQLCRITVESRWDEKAGLRRDAVGSQVIDALEAQEKKETGNEED
jgi:hypothetical protein